MDAVVVNRIAGSTLSFIGFLPKLLKIHYNSATGHSLAALELLYNILFIGKRGSARCLERNPFIVYIKS